MAVVVNYGVPRSLQGVTYDGSPLELSRNLEGFVWEPAQDQQETQLGPVLARVDVDNNTPIEIVSRAVIGYRSPSFLNDYYFRIYVTPASLDLGSVVSTQTTPVLVWNAFFDNLTLEAITGQTEGLELSGQPVPPSLFYGLDEKAWQLSVTTDGPAIVDDTLTWEFSNGTSASLYVSGTRIVAWAFRVDWSDGILERLEWLTTVTRSPLGREQRRKLRLSPRRTFKMKSIAKGTVRQFMELSLADAGGRNWALPFWPHNQFAAGPISVATFFIPCQTQYLDFSVGGMVLLCSDLPWENEVLEIASIELGGLNLVRPTTLAWPPGTRIVPAKVARHRDQPVIHRLTDELISVELSFEQTENAEWAGSLPVQLYRGLPVYLERPDESEDLTRTYIRLMEMIDNGTSRVRYFDTARLGFTAQAHRWFLNGRKNQADFRTLAYGLSGQWKSLWIPTHYADLQLIANADNGSLRMDVAWTGYTKLKGADTVGKRDLYILMRNGTHALIRVSSSTEEEGGFERLVLANPLPFAINYPDVLRISFMSVMRLDQDFIEINHNTDSEGLATSKAVLRSLRDTV